MHRQRELRAPDQKTVPARIAVLSDIHSNLDALKAVLRDARQRGVEAYLCLGDIVGFGPKPEACVRLIRATGMPTILGNHDEWAVSAVGRQATPSAGADFKGFKDPLSPLHAASREWLRTRPHLFESWGMSAAHSSFACPEKWNYLITRQAAIDSFLQQPTDIAFFGHTHTQGFWDESSSSFTAPTDSTEFALCPNRRYAINPGSVGNPLDDSALEACYLIFDTTKKTVTFCRIGYRRILQTTRR